MKQRFPYHRVTGTLDGRFLTYEECLSYIEHFNFIELKIPTAIIKETHPGNPFRNLLPKDEYSVWAWRKEFAPESSANSVDINGSVVFSVNKFGELFEQYKSKQQRD